MTYCHVTQQIASHVNEPVITAPQFDAPLYLIKLMAAHKPPYARHEHIEAAAAAYQKFIEEKSVTFASAEENRTVSHAALLETFKEEPDNIDEVFSLIQSDPLGVRSHIEEKVTELAIDAIWEAVMDFDEELSGIAA